MTSRSARAGALAAAALALFYGAAVLALDRLPGPVEVQWVVGG